MADAFYDLLRPHLPKAEDGAPTVLPPSQDPDVKAYLEYLPTLTLNQLTHTEPVAVEQEEQARLRALQELSRRSYSSIIESAVQFRQFPALISQISAQTAALKERLNGLEKDASDFAQKYDRAGGNEVLEQRKQAELLNRNADRIQSIKELPVLLRAAVSSATTAGAQTGTGTGAVLSGYASALDIHAHVKRLHALYPDSRLITDIMVETDDEIGNMVTALITSLQSPALKLAVAMRTIGWLRRVAPELTSRRARDVASGVGVPITASASDDEGALGATFLVCRLMTLRKTLDALHPLRQLADTETEQRQSGRQAATKAQRADGVQSERYLKRYIEVYREQSFSIISMYKSIFPSSLATPAIAADVTTTTTSDSDADVPAPPLASFVPEIVDMLFTTLQTYMPNVTERSSRDSLFSQVLFCAGSLGRLGADFGMMLVLLEEDVEGDSGEWVRAMEKHRIQASRLEVLASGVSTGRKGSVQTDVGKAQSPTISAK